MLRFGDFALDSDNRVLYRGGRPQALEPKVFDCLELLSHRAGELTTLAQLHRSLWPTVQVGPDALRRVIAAARKALGDDGKAQAWIKTRSGLGYVFVGEIERAPPRRPHDEPSRHAHRPWPFVGREAELTTLGRALEAAERASRGHTCLVAGPAGAGKSQLLAELRQRTADGATQWLVGRCQCGAAAAPFLPWADLAAQLLAAPAVAQARGPASMDTLEALRTLSRPGVLQNDASAERVRRCHRFADALGRLAGARPRCIVIEDLHWADEGSLLLLELLSRRSDDWRLCIIATYRSEEVPADGALAALLGRLFGRPAVTHLELPPLELPQLELLLARQTGARRPMCTSEALLRLTGGNPLFVRLLLTHLLSLHAGDDAGRLDRLPQSLRHTVRARLSALPATSARLLREASVLGASFALPLLAAVTKRSTVYLRRALAPVMTAGLLERHPEDPQSLRFCHELVRDCLYEESEESRRRELHRAACEAWCARGEWANSVAAAATHAFLAGEAVEVERTLRLCERAGKRALRALAFDQAALHLGRALATARSCAPLPAQAALALDYARACWYADQPAEAIASAFGTALELARHGASPAIFAEAAIGLSVGVDSPHSYPRSPWWTPGSEIALLEEALAKLGDGDAPLRLRVCFALSWMRMTDRDLEGASATAMRALGHDHRAATSIERCLSHRLRALPVWVAGRPDEACSAFEDALRECDGGALALHLRMDTLSEKLAVCLMFADMTSFDATLDRIDALAASLTHGAPLGEKLQRYSRYIVLAPFGRAMRSVMRGDFPQAERRIAALLELHARLRLAHVPYGELTLLLFRMQLQLYQGNCAALRVAIEGAITHFPADTWHLKLLLAQCMLEAGELEAARLHYRVARDSDFRARHGDRLSNPQEGTLARLSDLCVALGERQDAPVLYDRLRAVEGRCVFEGLSAAGGSADRYLGELAALTGRHERARAHLELAVETNRRIAARPERLRAQAALARTLDALGRSGDARALREATLGEARELGMAPALVGGRV